MIGSVRRAGAEWIALAFAAVMMVLTLALARGEVSRVAFVATGSAAFVYAVQRATARRNEASHRSITATLHYTLLADNTRDVVLFADSDGTIVEANHAAVATYGYPREQLIGLPLSVIAAEPPLGRDEVIAMSGGSRTTFQAVHHRKDGNSLPVEVSAVGVERNGEPAVLLLARDITIHRRRQAFEGLLRDVDRRILAGEALDHILTFTCGRLAQLYGYPLVQISLRGDDGRVIIRQSAGEAADFLSDIQVRWDETETAGGPTGTAIRTGEPQLRDLAADPGFAPWRDRALSFGLRTALALPLQARDRVLGALTMFMRHADAVPEEDLQLLGAFANQIALSLTIAWTRDQVHLRQVALEAAANAIVVTDPLGVIQWVNPAFSAITGYSAAEAVGQTPRILKSGNQTDGFYRQMWETLKRGQLWHGELYNRRKDGSLYIEEETITPVRDGNSVITHFVAIKQDITERKHQEERVRYLALHDALTDLPNRRALEARIERLCWAAESGRHGAILVLDIDNFKPVNDTVGHAGGDQVLAELAALLTDLLRPGDFLARLGGDEFAVVVDNASLSEAAGIAERILEAVSANSFTAGAHRFDLAVSIGVAAIDESADPSTAMVQADSALYAAKESGRNRVAVYPFADAGLTKLEESGRWAVRIRTALRDGRFVLHYQPVVRLGNGIHEHYEALLRMIGDDGELIPPDAFLASAERFCLMPQIDRWVVDSVITLLEQVESVRIFVNITGSSLGDESLLRFIEQRIREARLPPGRLAFEITETAAVTDLVAAQNWIRKLKDLGCLFAIDDFGVGFSSFSYLRALAVDYVKIDRSFVSDVDVNPTNRALVRAVQTVAETLGKEVIAEGIESDAHASVLREIGVELGQGYRWGAPKLEAFPRGGRSVDREPSRLAVSPVATANPPGDASSAQ